MSSEILTATANAVRGASVVNKLKTLATAHPVGAAVAGAVTVGLAGVGAYTVGRSVFKRFRREQVVVVQTPAPAAATTQTV